MPATVRLLVTLVTPVFVVLGLHYGISMPDIDQRTNLLIHRSIITHSPLIPFILFGLVSTVGYRLYRRFVIGLCVAFAVHHAFDLFPKEWTGYALIRIPFLVGTTPALFSWIWIAFSMCACAYLAARLVQGLMDILCYLLGFIYIFIVTVPKEHAWFGPIVALTVTIIVLGPTMLLRRKSDEA